MSDPSPGSDTTRNAAGRNTDRAQPGAVYQCPQCELGTLDLRTLEMHWMRVHAAEHGPFCHADIEVVNGP